MSEAVAWAIVFVADELEPLKMIERMFLCKDHAKAIDYCGDPTKPHDQPKRVRPLIFGDEVDE